MNEPIFKNVSQALHFSFLMEVLPATAKCSTQSAIEGLMKNSGRVFDSHVSTINTSGLTQLEVRGQCAMVRAIVNDYLQELERFAIWARYGAYDGKLAVYTKLNGVNGIAQYIGLTCQLDEDALIALVGNFYQIKESGSLRDIADKYKKSLSTLVEVKKQIAELGVYLEMKAIESINKHVMGHELVCAA